MKRFGTLFTAFLFLVSCGANDCSTGNGLRAQQKPITMTIDFAYVSAVNAENDGVTQLDQWLRENPGKKVVSFSGVLAYREGVSGYVVFFANGDNTKQKFAVVPGKLFSLQEWVDAHSQNHLTAVSTIPAYGGGVRENVICYE